jgi:hypothetical protein
MEEANGINEDGYSSFKPFEPGEHVIKCILDPEKNMNVVLKRYDKEDGTYYGLKCAWQAQCLPNGEECGSHVVFKFYWNLESNTDFVAMLKYTGLLEEMVQTFGNEPDYSSPEVEQFLAMKMPGKMLIADLYEKEAKPYIDKATGEEKEGKPQKDFNKIRPYGSEQSSTSGPDFD